MRPRLSSFAPLVTIAASLACTSTMSTLPRQNASNSVYIGDGGSTMVARYFSDVNTVADTVARPAAAVWAVLPGIYTSLGIPLSLVDSTSRILGALRVPMRNRLGKRPLSAYLECGVTPVGSPRANGYLIALTVLSQVHDIGDGRSVVRTAVAGTARDDAGSSNDAQCGSMGALERAINVAAATH